MYQALHLVIATIPTFPLDYYSGEQSNILQAHGMVRHPGERLCCSKDSPNCQIKVQSMGSDNFVQGSKERRLQMGRGVTMDWRGSVHKLMALVPGATKNSSHKWACALYCPEPHNFSSTIAVAPKGERVIDRGRHRVTQSGAPGSATKDCATYEWTEKALKIIPVALDVAYVDDSGSSPVPFLRSTVIELNPVHPLHPVVQAYLNISYVGFVPGDKWGDKFDIDMDSITACKRQEEGKCPNDPHHPHGSHTAEAWHGRATAFDPTIEDLVVQRLEAMRVDHISPADVAAVAVPAGVANAADGVHALPTFSNDSISVETTSVAISQGGVDVAGEGTCCSEDAPACQVQRSKGTTTVYRDYTHARMRSESNGEVHVDFFDKSIMKSVMVNVTASGEEFCMEYCPIPVNERFRPFSLPTDAKDRGHATIDGVPVEHYTWEDRIIGVIPMSKTDFYARTNGSLASPAFEFFLIEPLGNPMGTRNTTWVQYTPTTPPASKFNISGLDTCKRGQCQGPVFQMHRLRAGHMRSFEHYYKPDAYAWYRNR